MKARARDALIDYRLEQANKTLHQAEVLAEACEWEGVINRAYYAMFYASLALLLSKNIGSSKHSGVIALINREFVRSGLFPVEMARGLRDAFNQRQKYDYGEFQPASEDVAVDLLGRARRYLDTVKTALGRL